MGNDQSSTSNGSRTTSTTKSHKPSADAQQGAGAGGGTPVVLNVYNLQRLKSSEQSVNQRLGFGFYHSGLELFGKEWTFGGNPNAEVGQSGIFAAPPKSVLPMNQFYESVTLGVLPPAVKEVHLFAILKDLQQDWAALSYHLLAHNCNHFIEALREAICTSIGPLAGLGPGAAIHLKKIPTYVNRAARVADFFVPEALYRSMMGSVPQSNGAGGAATPQAPPAASPTTTAAEYAIPDRLELEKKSVRQLKTLMWVNGVSSEGCIEKCDLVERLVSFQAVRAARK